MLLPFIVFESHVFKTGEYSEFLMFLFESFYIEFLDKYHILLFCVP